MLRQMRAMPLWRDASRLQLLIEEAVRCFSRYHKYTLGSELRQQVMEVCCLIVRAYNDRDGRPALVTELVTAVDRLKVQVQLAKELRAFRHFQEFQAIAELAVAVGRQSGGWQRRLMGAA